MGGQAKAKKKNKGNKRERRPNNDARQSAEQRMKLKMQERAKKKTAVNYTVDQLLEKTEECMDNFNFETAQLFCQRALDIEPTNLKILDMFGNICAELGDMEKAKQAFLKAVELSPEKGHSKYMYLGQVHTGLEALQYFTKGIEVMLSKLKKETHLAAGAAAALSARSLTGLDPELTGKDVAMAFCSVAEIFFTDLCTEEGAAEKCREAVEKALQYEPNNPEALQLMASYLFSTDKAQEGKEYLMRSVAAWLPSQRQQATANAEDEDKLQSAIPPYESRITTAKLLVETEEYEMATEVLEGLLEEDDEVVQVWYLLGWVCYLQVEKPEDGEAFRESARAYLTKARKLYVKLRCDDVALLEHVEQLLAELGPGEESAGSENEEPQLDDIGDDFVESSDEEDAMEH